MSKAANDVVISGIGIVTCQGVGKDAHIALLSAASTPKAIVEIEKFKPYPVHPLPEIDWSQQIAKRGDQRQMENWQRIGVFASLPLRSMMPVSRMISKPAARWT